LYRKLERLGVKAKVLSLKSLKDYGSFLYDYKSRGNK